MLMLTFTGATCKHISLRDFLNILNYQQNNKISLTLYQRGLCIVYNFTEASFLAGGVNKSYTSSS